jgi:hypothetical protein
VLAHTASSYALGWGASVLVERVVALPRGRFPGAHVVRAALHLA